MLSTKTLALLASLEFCMLGAARADTVLFLDQFPSDTVETDNMNGVLGPPRQTGTLVGTGISYTVGRTGGTGAMAWESNGGATPWTAGEALSYFADYGSRGTSCWADKNFGGLTTSAYAASVLVDSSTGNSGPFFVAMSTAQDTADMHPATGASGEVDHAGNWNLYVNGASVSTGTLASASTHTLSLGFNDTAGTVSLIVDGSSVASSAITWGSTDRYLGVGRPSGGGASSVQFDNLQLSAVSAPEPSSSIIMIAAMMGLLAYAWRKRR
jgi:hypothetical protein